MKITINAHQLGRLIDKTISHIGSEDIESLHGIRLDVDSTHLYAVASDRYTLAVARYSLNHGDKGQESVGRTIPADYLRPLREWISAMKGSMNVVIEAGVGRLVFDTPLATYSVAVTDSLEFPDWRGLLRSIAEQTVDGDPFPALDSRLLKRWADTNQIVRVRVTADQKAVLMFAEDFIGAHMPARYAGVGPCKDETIDSARHLWKDVLDAGTSRADMATDMPDEDQDRPRYEVTTDIRETGEMLLQQTLRSGWDMRGKSSEKPDEFLAHCLAAVNGWTAFRYLDALHNVDPRAAQAVVSETASELDSGEIGEFAWDASKTAGFDPEKWQDDYNDHLKKQADKWRAERWERVAMAFNAATQAGVSFRIEPNPHVQWDADNNRWVTTENTASEAAA